MKAVRKSISLKIVAVLMALAVCGAIGSVIALSSDRLPESQAAPATQGNLMVGEEVSLSGTAAMNLMTVNGSPAYSVAPGRANPASGTYTLVSPPQPPQQSTLATLRAVMYASYGAPGFDESFYPSTYYDGSVMTPEKYQVATYVMVSDIYGLEWGNATDGASDEFKTWANSVLSDTLGKIEETPLWTTPSSFTLVEIQAPYPQARILSFVPGGYAQLTVSSVAPIITDGNPMYSLEDGVYRIYDNAACSGNPEGVFETNDDGTSNTIYLNEGTHYIKQTTASNGYALSDDVITVEIANGVTTVVTVSSTPLVDTEPLVILKRDANHQSTDKANTPQGGVSLADAQYTVSYYQADLSTVAEAEAETPTWTKTLITSWDGSSATAAPTASDFVSNGTVSGWPIGTYLVKETKAPRAGYFVDSVSSYLFSISVTGDTTASSKVIVGTVNGSPADTISASNPLISSDRVFSGNISLMRYTNGAGTTGEVPVVGAEYQIINDNDYPVMNPSTKAWVTKGEVVCTIRTNAQGYASTQSVTNTTGNTCPLAFGTYTVQEVASSLPAGVTTVGSLSTSIMLDGQNRWFRLDETAGASIRVNKVDKDSKSFISGTTQFRVLQSDGTTPVAFNDTYPETNRLTTLTADATGRLVLPQKLAAGNYFLEEVTAPYGYQKATSTIPFIITAEQATTSSYATPVDVDLPDENAWGSITVNNKDIAHYPALDIVDASAVYKVYAAEDIYTEDGTKRKSAGDEVATLTTTNGTATTGNLYLGKYVVKQVTAPNGYLIDETEYPVTLSYLNDTTLVVNETLTLYNTAVMGTVNAHKVDATSKKVVPASGTVFEIKAAEDIVGKDGYRWYVAGETVDTVVTGSDGYAAGTKLLPLGNYQIVEKSAPYPYVLNTTPTPVSLEYADDATAVVAPADDGAVEDERALTVFRVSKEDRETEKLVTTPNTQIEVHAAEDIVMPEGSTVFEKDELVDTITTDTTGYMTGTVKAPVGNYYLIEKSAPSGYVLDNTTKHPISFVYPGQTVPESVTAGEIADVPAKGTISFSKVDADNGTTVKVAGIKANVYANTDIVTGDGEVRAEADELVATLITGEDGTAVSEPLYLGSYRVAEVEAPGGYLLNETPLNIMLSYENQNVPIVTESAVISDHNAKGVIEVTKIDAETKNTIAAKGTTFEIYAKTDIVTPDGTRRAAAGEKVADISTDDNGIATSPELFLGIYTIHETKAPTGYALSLADQDVVLAYKDQVTAVVTASEKFANTVQKGQITVSKLDAATGNTVQVPGAKFEVVADSDITIPDGSTPVKAGEVVDTVTTDETGKASTKALYIGDYTVKEIAAPNGYTRTDATDSVSMEYGDQSVSILPYEASISNDLVMGTISLNVVDSREKNQLAGTKWNIVAAEDITTGDGTVQVKKGEVAGTITTAAEGMAVSEKLYLGKYELVQTYQIDEYERNLTPYEVTLTAANDVESVVNVDVTLSNRPTDVTITKMGNANNALTDVRFVAWLDGNAADFTGAAVFSAYALSAVEMTQISDFDNMSAEFEKTTALAKNPDLSKTYNVFTSDETLPKGVYKLHVEYKDGTDSYKLDEIFTVNDTDSNAIFFIGKLGTDGASNSFRDIANIDPIVDTSQTSDVPEVATTTLVKANQMMDQFYAAADELAKGYKDNKAYVNEELGDTYAEALEEDMENLGEIVRIQTKEAVENYQLGTELRFDKHLADGSELIVSTISLMNKMADALKNQNIDVAVPDEEDASVAIRTLAIKYVNDNAQFTVEKSKSAIEAFYAGLVADAKQLESVPDSLAIVTSVESYALNGDIENLKKNTDLDSYFNAYVSSFDALSDDGNNIEKYQSLTDELYEIPRQAFIIYAIEHPVLDRTELLTAPAGICNRVPVVLTDGIFASSASDDSGILEFRYIPQGSFSVAESSAPDGYSNDYRVNKFKIGDDGHVSDESTLAPNATMNDDGNVTILNNAINLTVSKLASETGTELPGNMLALYAVDDEGNENLIDTWVSETEPKTFTAISVGNYVLKEEQAADGYSIASPLSFRVLDTTEPQRVSMENSTLDGVFGNGGIMGQLGDAMPFIGLSIIVLASGIAMIIWHRSRRRSE